MKTKKKPARRRPSLARVARDMNVDDASSMLIMMRNDCMVVIDKLGTALTLLIGWRAVKDLQDKDRKS